MGEVWDSLYINCFQYLGSKTIEEIERMEYKDYLMRMEAHRRNRLEKERDIHYLAYLNMVVETTEEKSKGKYTQKYDKFSKFFDYEEVKKDIVGITRDDKVEEIRKKDGSKNENNRIKDLILEANKGGE